jgi:hypothetical protein
MLIIQFNELEDLDKYLNHPVHLEVSKYIKEKQTAHNEAVEKVFRKDLSYYI